MRNLFKKYFLYKFTLNRVSVIAQIPQNNGDKKHRQQYGHPLRPIDSLIRPNAQHGHRNDNKQVDALCWQHALEL